MPIDHARVAAALEDAPAWARIGLSVRDKRMRAAALHELAQCVAASLNGPLKAADVARDPG